MTITYLWQSEQCFYVYIGFSWFKQIGDSNHITGVLYATTLHTSRSKDLLEAALNAVLATRSDDSQPLYSIYYEQQQANRTTKYLANGISPSLDLAFNDLVLDDVAAQWKAIMGNDVDELTFMKFEERPGMSEDDNDNDNEIWCGTCS